MALPAIKVGCDPELFLVDRVTGLPVSAYGLLPGTKKEPYRVDKGAVQVDGTATEFNIEPASTEEQFHENITTVLGEMTSMLPETVMLCDMPTAIFDLDYFKSLPPQALEMGCDPDYDAYTRLPNERPTTDLPMRTAGGHIHIGWRDGADIQDPDHMADCIEVVKQLDFYLGLPSLIWDPDNKRRQLYGKAGAFRIKTYGVEYRPLSCMWVQDATIRSFIFKAAQGALRDLYTGHVARNTIGDHYAYQQFLRPTSVDYFVYLKSLPFFAGFDTKSFYKHCANFARAHTKVHQGPPENPYIKQFAKAALPNIA